MLPASCKGGGNCATMGPLDVCKTPAPPAPVPPPIPYPNFGMVMQATGASSKVKICGSQAVTIKSEIPMSTGDEPGVAGGMVSSVFKGKVEWKMGSSKVKAEGNKVVHLTSMTMHNKGNAPGMQVAPSQVKVLVSM